MPRNRFPDSLAKQELRRRDARSLQAFITQRNQGVWLRYCGMPSVEFLDVQAWKDCLRSVCAVECDQSVLRDMRIQWDILSLSLPTRYVTDDILDFLQTTSDCFDVYNLDFYGGFLNPSHAGGSRCCDAMRDLIVRQSKNRNSFALIVTFNVRDRGAQEYHQFIDEIPEALAGWRDIDACCKAHKKNHITKLKICFSYFCWHTGTANNFAVKLNDPIVYQSSATMLHFYMEFIFEPRALPVISTAESLARIASQPLYRMNGRLLEPELIPPVVTRS